MPELLQVGVAAARINRQALAMELAAQAGLGRFL
jgi:hypothetical protein